jgi:hypothetical protein
MAITQYLLASAGGGFSGRGVRLRTIKPGEKDKIAEKAAMHVGKDASVIEFRNEEIRQSVFRMLVAVTKTADMKTADQLLALPADDWEKMDLEKLNFRYDDLFTPKDDAFLASIYRRVNEVSQSEVEDIAGKAMSVSEG